MNVPFIEQGATKEGIAKLGDKTIDRFDQFENKMIDCFGQFENKMIDRLDQFENKMIDCFDKLENSMLKSMMVIVIGTVGIATAIILHYLPS